MLWLIWVPWAELQYHNGTHVLSWHVLLNICCGMLRLSVHCHKYPNKAKWFCMMHLELHKKGKNGLIHTYTHKRLITAFIPIVRCFSTHGYFSPSILGCFILDHKEGRLNGDIVVLGQDTGWKVVMEEIIEVERHFILYKVKEVGLIPMGGVQITQLVAPLNSHPSVFLCFLLLIIMALFPCFFWSSAIFGKLDGASGRDEVQSC